MRPTGVLLEIVALPLAGCLIVIRDDIISMPRGYFPKGLETTVITPWSFCAEALMGILLVLVIRRICWLMCDRERYATFLVTAFIGGIAVVITIVRGNYWPNMNYGIVMFLLAYAFYTLGHSHYAHIKPIPAT
jgi:hypothetical protein